MEEINKVKRKSTKNKSYNNKKRRKKMVPLQKPSFFEQYFYLIIAIILSLFFLFSGLIYYKKMQNVNYVISKNDDIFVEKKNNFPDLKTKNSEINNIINSDNYNKIKEFSSENLNIFLDILAKNTTSFNLKYSILDMKNIPYEDVVSNISKLNSLYFLNQQSSNLYNGILTKNIGLKLSYDDKISSLNNFSFYWGYGLKIGDKLIGLDGKKLKSGVDKQILYQEILKRTSQWKLKNGKEISIKQGKLKEDITNVIDLYAYKDTLVIRVKEINNFISYYLYLLSKPYLENRNYSGLIIDLSNVSDKYYFGVDTFLYLITGNNKDYIANFSNELNKNNEEFLTKKPDFDVPDWYINKLKSMEKVVVINQKTEGSPEVIANYLYKKGAIITGYNSKNNKEKHTVYSLDNKLFSFKTDDVIINNNKFGVNIIKIEKEKYPDFLYMIYDNYNR